MTELRDVVICAPLRTPVGRMGGALATVPAPPSSGIPERR